jgi:hypothetical protein
MGKFNSQPVQGMKTGEIHKVFHKGKAAAPVLAIGKSSVMWVLPTGIRNLSRGGLGAGASQVFSS